MDFSVKYRQIEKSAEAALNAPLSVSRQEQELFIRWSGIAPAQFFAPLSSSALRKELAERPTPQRPTPLVVEEMSEAEYRSKGGKLNLRYGFAETPFGDCFVATADEAICDIQFVEEPEEQMIERFAKKWFLSPATRDDRRAQQISDTLFSTSPENRILLRGTPFQVQIWRTLVQIPSGALRSYDDVARLAGTPKAVRAAASAVAKNPIGVLVPCHRVVRKEGAIGQFRWGSLRKAILIGWEKAKRAFPE